VEVFFPSLAIVKTELFFWIPKEVINGLCDVFIVVAVLFLFVLFVIFSIILNPGN
jgi:hypothetical protein